ncbi:hypothetical protein G3I28_34875, partial [Streptomyces sp. SID10116]|nr:hypothetical protein [Streptomyces sp. SID10116]
LARLAGEAVDGFGAYGSFGQGGDGWSSYQTLSRVRPETLLARVLAALRAESAAEPGTERPAFTDRLLADEVRRRIEGFRER